MAALRSNHVSYNCSSIKSHKFYVKTKRFIKFCLRYLFTQSCSTLLFISHKYLTHTLNQLAHIFITYTLIGSNIQRTHMYPIHTLIHRFIQYTLVYMYIKYARFHMHIPNTYLFLVSHIYCTHIYLYIHFTCIYLYIYCTCIYWYTYCTHTYSYIYSTMFSR